MDKQQKKKTNIKNSIEKNVSSDIPQNKKRKRGKAKIILLVILVIFLLAGGTFAYKTYKNGGGLQGILATAVGHDEETRKDLPEFHVLLMGISTDISVKLSDTIMIASYNPNTQKATLVSVPRDSYVGENRLAASSYDKINALCQEGPEKTLEAVNKLTGLNLDKYVVIDTEALTELVDAIGGVDFDVPIDMKYDDNKQDLHINLKKGMQHLDGQQAEWVVRFRHNNDGTSYPSEYGDNDIGRMRTQRAFITAVIEQTLQAKNIFKIGNILDIASKYVDTNLDLNQVKDYAPYAVEFDMKNLKTANLPGTPNRINGLWFYDVDEEESADLLEDLFAGKDPEDRVVDEDRIGKKIEIINGSGKSSNLSDAMLKLKQKGYTIYKTRNTNDVSKTKIISYGEQDKDFADDIKNIIGNGTGSKGQESDEILVDYTIVIGEDYEKGGN